MPKYAIATRPGAPAPSVETILHAVLPHKFVDHTHADAVLAITNTAGGEARIAAEGFADRVYADDGQLVSRKLGKDALVSDPSKAAEQAVRMVMEQKVKTITGKTITAKVDTICIHGDSPGADKIVTAVRDGLVKAGAVVKPLRDWFKG